MEKAQKEKLKEVRSLAWAIAIMIVIGGYFFYLLFDLAFFDMGIHTTPYKALVATVAASLLVTIFDHAYKRWEDGAVAVLLVGIALANPVLAVIIALLTPLTLPCAHSGITFFAQCRRAVPR